VLTTADGAWLTVTSATLRSVLNVVRMIGLDEARFATWELQNEGKDVIDDALGHPPAERTADECLAAMREFHVTGDRIFDMEDILADEIYAEREDIITMDDPELGPIRMQGIVPKLVNAPGHVWRPGPALGEDNALVYGDWLGLGEAELAGLEERSVI